MSREGSLATDGPQSRRGPWRLVHGGGGAQPSPSAAITPSDSATNMAVDQALLDAVKAGSAPVLRFYRWSPATLSFGRNQPAQGRYDRTAAAARGIEFVRRPTGGQAVLHDDELTYAVVAPVSVIGKPRAAYALINRALLAGLRRLGVPATLAEAGALARSGSPAGPAVGGGASNGPDWDAACFRRPERGEVMVGGAKLVGSAQRTEARTILQHGSILVGGSQAPAEELLIMSKSTGEGGWTTVERELGRRPSWEGLVEAVLAGFGEVLGTAFDPAPLTELEAEVAASHRTRFASDEWTWRR